MSCLKSCRKHVRCRHVPSSVKGPRKRLFNRIFRRTSKLVMQQGLEPDVAMSVGWL